MEKLKTLLVWLIFGYDNRPIRTHLKYCNSNLNVLGVLRENQDISDFKLSAPHGYLISPNDYSSKESETFNVLEIKGEIFLKPSNDTKIFYKIIFMFPLIFGFVLDKFGLFWAVESFIIINIGTLILQFKNHQILRLKLDEITSHLNLSAYFKILRLKLSLERLSEFKKRTLSDYENHIQQQDILHVREMIKDKDFLESRYSKFIVDLEFFINELDLELPKYEDIMSCMNDHLQHNFEIRTRSLDMIKKKLDYSLLKDLSFFEG
jgi:hypothetical protein